MRNKTLSSNDSYKFTSSSLERISDHHHIIFDINAALPQRYIPQCISQQVASQKAKEWGENEEWKLPEFSQTFSKLVYLSVFNIWYISLAYRSSCRLKSYITWDEVCSASARGQIVVSRRRRRENWKDDAPRHTIDSLVGFNSHLAVSERVAENLLCASWNKLQKLFKNFSLQIA